MVSNDTADRLAEALCAYGRRVIDELLGDTTAVVDVKHMAYGVRRDEADVLVVVRYLTEWCTEPAFVLLHGTESDIADEGEPATREGLRATFAEVYMEGDQVRWLIGALDPQEPAV